MTTCIRTWIGCEIFINTFQLWAPQRMDAVAVLEPRVLERARRTAAGRRSSEKQERAAKRATPPNFGGEWGYDLAPNQPHHQCLPRGNLAPCVADDLNLPLWLIAKCSASLASRGGGRLQSRPAAGAGV